MSVVSKQTHADLRTVCEFFCIDQQSNAHIFRHAADNHGDAFATCLADLAAAIQTDRRRGTSQRLRASIAEEKARRGAIAPTPTR